ncbi:hypothetical protein DFH94DRAFT_628117 [Russula ochroleuca]|uniref:Uncharacterized protein n=1 Tax=Russula ochroleuca TaxID=152965 RepID=A0A9P5MYH7_9AGAM|nr:hypothetical protein DFH94DRAFT_628117 [Russula ochroleuca]
MPSVSSDALQTLQIAAISLACLTGLFGVYLVIFVLAIWSTYRQATMSSKRLRWVTIVLFVDLCIHFVTRSLQFSRARLLRDSNQEFLRWSIPLTVIGNVTTTISGLLSDGTLAWRFYVVYNKAKWALYLPAGAVAFNALLCWSADGQHLAAYSRPEYYENTLLPVTLDITVAWGWSMFVANSLMTGGIIYKIMWAQRSSHSLRQGTGRNPSRYANAIRAIIESAVVTWIGIVLAEIGMLAPTGGITTNQDVGTVILNIIPVFFGISQCLITAHLGLVREAKGIESTGVYSSTQVSQGVDSETPRSMTTFKVYTDVTTVTDQDYK